MKPITPIAHGCLDYLTVAVFLIAPKLIGMDGFPVFLSYTLAGAHLALTLATDFPLGWLRWVKFQIHGSVERAIGEALLFLALAMGFTGSILASRFYLFMGLSILVVQWLTNYSKETN